MNEGGKEEREREEGEEDGIPVRCWADVGSSGLGCERQRLYWRGRWRHQAEGTPASRKGEEAARTIATHFFFDGRMRGGFASFCLAFRLFVSFILSG
jgi:hypothetical protein